MFSSRLPAALAPNAIARSSAAVRARQVTLLDLTESNPTVVGLPYPPDVLAPLGHPNALRYAPDPLGLESARRLVEARGLKAPGSGATVLTAGTSDSYSMLFKLLCDPGDEVLAPAPSYPLFDMLTGLDGVIARPYPLEYHGVWSINRERLFRELSPRTRAVLVVSPNNPTGSMTRQSDRDWLALLGAERGLAIVSDEVFRDYPLRPASDAASFADETRALTFVLGGLSKSAGLPQVKLGWITASGPEELVDEAIGRLELIADTYLSVSTPVQLALPALIESGAIIRREIQARIALNLATLERYVRPDGPVTLLPPEGGWTAVLRVPATVSEESLVLRLMDEAHVLVHPGFFFDFPHEAFLVVSLLPEPAIFEEAVKRLILIASGEPDA